ncbi:MAG: TetR/AcrR family transcriptional regulator [Anaerolineae bacterium]
MSVIDSRTLNRAERRRLHTRDLLLEAASAVLAESGYQTLTIKAITDRADVGYGTFYLHFADKDDIVWEVIHTTVENYLTSVEPEILKYPSPEREYQSWIRTFEFAEQARDGIVSMLGRNGSATLLQRYQDYLAALYERNLRDGRYTSGLNLPPTFLAQFATGGLIRLLIWWLETPNDYTPKQMAAMLYEAVYRQPALEG